MLRLCCVQVIAERSINLIQNSGMLPLRMCSVAFSQQPTLLLRSSSTQHALNEKLVVVLGSGFALQLVH